MVLINQPTNLPGVHCSCKEGLNSHEECGGSSKEKEFFCPQVYRNEKQAVLYEEISDRRIHKNVIHAGSDI